MLRCQANFEFAHSAYSVEIVAVSEDEMRRGF